jgi:hypothetical protein
MEVSSMKKFFVIVALFSFCCLTTTAVATPCPPGTISCSENYTLSPPEVIKTQTPMVKTKKVRFKTFTAILKKNPENAIESAQQQAENWLNKQSPDTIMSQSQAVTCTRQDSCDAFVTIMYWKMEVASKEKIAPPPTEHK